MSKLLPHILTGILLFGIPLVASAADGFVPLAEVSGQSKLGELYNGGSGDLSNFINSLFKFAIALGALAAVLRLAYAGYLYMGQADMWSHKGEAKTIIGDVTLGLLLLLGIYLILYQINPDIVKLNALRNVTQAQQISNPPSTIPSANTPTGFQLPPGSQVGSDNTGSVGGPGSGNDGGGTGW